MKWNGVFIERGMIIIWCGRIGEKREREKIEC